MPGPLARFRLKRTCARALWLIPPRGQHPGTLWQGGTPGGPRSWSLQLGAELAPGEVRRLGRNGLARLEALAGRDLVLARPPELSDGSSPREDLPAGLLWLETRGPAPIPDAEVLALAGDLARAQRAASERLGAREQERLAQVGERSAALLHDLRNDLTYGLLLLDGDGPDLAPLREHLAQVRTLCQGELDEGRRPASAPERILLASFLEEQARQAERLACAAQRPGEVRVECAPGLRAWADPTALRRLLKNLLLNAMAASPRGNLVNLEAVAGDSSRVELLVRDRGRGMDRAAQQRFARPGQSGQPGGTGFGTSSAAACARRLNTRLHITSQPTRGTKVSFRLDEAPPPEAKLLLLVDQLADRRRRRARALRTRGRAVFACAEPAQASAVLAAGGVHRVEIARGTSGPGQAELLAACSGRGLVPVLRSVR
ncbi:MAG: hypothetical protein CMK00_02935 [Planctomycetes bacterium]|nr:hypothetical protein [Planctomycetota bacterium]